MVLALAAAGVGRGKAAKATRALKAHVVDYTGGGDPDEYYAGSFAKLLVVAAARNADPRSFGGSDRSDLVAELRALECRPTIPGCDLAERGRFSDISQFGDFSSVISQSLAVLGLTRTTQRGAVEGRRLVPARPAVPQRRLPPGPRRLRVLQVGGRHRLRGAGAVRRRHPGRAGGRPGTPGAGSPGSRSRNGSFGSDGVRNANSTALAAQALDVLDRSGRRAKAVRFLRSLQSRCGAPAALRGSVRYSRADAGDRVLATSQAVPALAGVTLVEVDKAGTTAQPASAGLLTG